MKNIFVALITTVLFGPLVFAQGSFSGDLQLNYDFFIRDTVRNASGTPHYDYLKNGAESWLGLNYDNPDIDLRISTRLDMFYNSNLIIPGTPFSSIGVGKISVWKKVHNLELTGGHIYDQFGNGTLFRAYEDRSQGIDNSLFGVGLKYHLSENWYIKGVLGKLKDLKSSRLENFGFSFYDSFLSGVNLNGNVKISEKVSIQPGASVFNRTMGEDNYQSLRQIIQDNNITSIPDPSINVYGFELYNNLNIGGFSWGITGAYKTDDVIPGIKERDGTFVSTNLGYSTKGFGIVIDAKRTENFPMRTSVFETENDGVLNYLTTVNRQNSLRLLSKYNPAIVDTSEMAFGGEITFKPQIKGKRNFAFSLGYSENRDKDFDQLYFREFYFDTNMKLSKKIKLQLGTQFLEYNQDLYEFKPGVANVKALTPFTELTYKITRKASLRWELQYLSTKQDGGDWAWGLMEFNFAPNWSVSISDMWNIDPLKTSVNPTADDTHFPTLFASYTYKANKFTLGYIKQVEGIVCTGGVCRREPAFSGIKLGISSSF